MIFDVVKIEKARIMRTGKTRRKRRLLLLIPGILVLILMIYVFLIEPYSISVEIVRFDDDDLFRVLSDKKVVQISDLHITKFGRREKKMIQMLNRLSPDILFITGDFLTNGKDEASCTEALRQITKPPHGILAVLGNTDRFLNDGSPFEGEDRFIGKLKDLGINVFENRWQRLDLGSKGGSLYILGIEEAILSRAKLESLLRDIPEESPIILLSHFPDVLERSTDVLVVNLEEAEGGGISGWGWQDNAHFEYDSGVVRFEEDGIHTIRIQNRETGVSIEQICFVASSYTLSPSANLAGNSAAQDNPEDTYASINPHSGEMIIIKAKDIPDSEIFGSWRKVRDSSSSFEIVIKDTARKKKKERPFQEPKDYFEANFYAEGGVDYHLWVRMKAENDSPSHDSVYVQFSDSVDERGRPVYRIGELGDRPGLERINLILAGHTHGGQVRLPFIGALDVISDHKIPYELGLFKSQGTRMYVNRGIGVTLVPVRFCCSPEITVFRFEKTRDSSEG